MPRLAKSHRLRLLEVSAVTKEKGNGDVIRSSRVPVFHVDSTPTNPYVHPPSHHLYLTKRTVSSSIFNPADQISLDRKIAVGLERIAEGLKAVIWNETKQSGLSPIQIQFLIALQFEMKTEWTIGDLAERFGLTPATVSDAVTSLEEKGLVQRKKKGGDRRTVYLHLTPSGRRAARKLGGWANILQDSLAGMSPEEKTVMLKGVLSVLRSFRTSGVVSTVQMCTTCKFFRSNTYRNSRGPHHCALLDVPLSEADLRVDCPEHEPQELARVSGSR